jgi:hypothetical protein
MNTLRLTVLSALVVLSACSKAQPAPTPKAAELSPVDMGNHPTILPLPDPDLQGGHVGRAPRRLTVAQLGQSILTTTGRQWSQLNARSASLGQADFALVNAEGTETNLVFTKFLEDGAREVCLAAATEDLAKASAADRLLSPNLGTDLAALTDAELTANFGYLSTRFWGQPLKADELTQWISTFRAVAAKANTSAALKKQAWASMCIAMMTDARFFTY